MKKNTTTKREREGERTILGVMVAVAAAPRDESSHFSLVKPDRSTSFYWRHPKQTQTKKKRRKTPLETIITITNSLCSSVCLNNNKRKKNEFLCD